METVLITAKIRDRKKNEFYQVMESFEKIIKNHCNDFNMVIDQKNNLKIKIIFEEKKESEHNFNNNEFNLLKGTIRSLCDNVSIKLNDTNLN